MYPFLHRVFQYSKSPLCCVSAQEMQSAERARRSAESERDELQDEVQSSTTKTYIVAHNKLHFVCILLNTVHPVLSEEGCFFT